MRKVFARSQGLQYRLVIILLLFLISGHEVHAAHFDYSSFLNADGTVKAPVVDMSWWNGAIPPGATVITCDTNCYPTYLKYIGAVHVVLTCDANSPAYFIGVLTVNDIVTYGTQQCCGGATGYSCTGLPAVITGSCNTSVLSSADVLKVGTPCVSTAVNSCGQTSSGIYICDAAGQVSCSAGTPSDLTCSPVNCSGYWSDVSNSCSKTCGTGTLQQTYTRTQNGSNGGDTSCPATGTTRSGSTSCNTQVCCVAKSGTACEASSATNGCGMTTTGPGTYSCDGTTCVPTPPAPAAPANSSCTHPPAPSISGPWRGSSIASPAYAYDPLGYQVFAQATSPYATNPAVDSHLTYYFEYSTDGVNWRSAGDWASQKK